MTLLTDILKAVYLLFFNPIDVDVLAEQYETTIRNMVELNSINLSINYIDFSNDVFRNIINLSRTVILPVGYAILAYLMVLELYNVYTKSEGMTGVGAFQVPLKIIIKTVIFKFILDRAHDLLEAIFNLILHIQNKTFSYSLEHSISKEAIDDFKAQVEGMNFLQKITQYYEVKIYQFFAAISIAIVMIVAVARIFEIYIYLFIAPIPLATLSGGELSQIGKNFLKSFTAICLQGVILALILFLYSQFAKIFVVGDTLKEQFWKGFSAIVVLSFCLMRSGRWAKSICNAM